MLSTTGPRLPDLSDVSSIFIFNRVYFFLFLQLFFSQSPAFARCWLQFKVTLGHAPGCDCETVS